MLKWFKIVCVFHFTNENRIGVTRSKYNCKFYRVYFINLFYSAPFLTHYRYEYLPTRRFFHASFVWFLRHILHSLEYLVVTIKPHVSVCWCGIKRLLKNNKTTWPAKETSVARAFSHQFLSLHLWILISLALRFLIWKYIFTFTIIKLLMEILWPANMCKIEKWKQLPDQTVCKIFF